jgi:WD40 repeat protein
MDYSSYSGMYHLNALTFSPDGKYLASNLAYEVHVWEVATGKVLPSCGPKLYGLKFLAFLPDSKTLIGGIGNEILLWDVTQGKKLRQIRLPEGWALRAVTRDGKRLAVGEASGYALELWDMASGKCVRQFETNGESLSGNPLTFSLDGKWLAGSWGGVVNLWAVENGKHLRRFDGHRGGQVQSIAFSADGRLIAAQGDQVTLRVWEVATGKPVASLNKPLSNASSVAFSSDGNLLAAGSRGEFGVWDLKTRQELHVGPESRGVLSAVWSPTGALVASGGVSLWVWDASTGRPVRRFGRDGDWETPVAFSKDDTQLVTFQWNQAFAVTVWKVASGKQLRRILGPSKQWGPLAVALSRTARKWP